MRTNQCVSDMNSRWDRTPQLLNNLLDSSKGFSSQVWFIHVIPHNIDVCKPVIRFRCNIDIPTSQSLMIDVSGGALSCYNCNSATDSAACTHDVNPQSTSQKICPAHNGCYYTKRIDAGMREVNLCQFNTFQYTLSNFLSTNAYITSLYILRCSWLNCLPYQGCEIALLPSHQSLFAFATCNHLQFSGLLRWFCVGVEGFPLFYDFLRMSGQ